MSLTGPIDPWRKDYALVLKDLQLKSGENPILRGCSLAVPRKKLYGILGESGAGKSTLLRLVARKLDESCLTIEGAGFFPNNIWFIAQENVLYEYDTPLEVVSFLHRMIHGSSQDEATTAAEELIKRVGFPATQAYKLIGTEDDGLSVGTRRMLNVSLALCAEARVILLDEPTTGLDSWAARNLVEVLKRVCTELDITCICTIHQPNDETLSFFDNLIVMNMGRAFVQPPVITNEGDYSKAETLLSMMRRGDLAESKLPPELENDPAFQQALQATVPLKDQLERLKAVEPDSYLRQVSLLFRRTAIRQWNNAFALRFRFIAAIGVAIMVGIFFWKLPYDDPTALRDHMGLHLVVTGCSFVPIVISAGFFPAERTSFLNEMGQSRRFALSAYIIARTMFDLLLALLTSVSTFIVVGMCGITQHVERFWFTLLLQGFASDALGFFFSTLFRPEVSISAMIPCVGFFSLLVGTGITQADLSGAGWIFHVLKWVSFFKYGFGGIAKDQLLAVTGNCIPGVMSGCTFPNSYEGLKYLRLDSDIFTSSYSFNWMMLAIVYFTILTLSCARLWHMVANNKHSYAAATSWKKKEEGEKKKPGSGIDLKAAEEHSFVEGTVRKAKSSRLTWTGTNITAFGTISKLDKLLIDVTGVAQSGELLAVIGPSQSGKTLLLKVLSQQIPISGIAAGDCQLQLGLCGCGEECGETGLRLVYQQDLFVPGDTVTEAVRRGFAFSMKMDESDYDKECEALLRSVGIGHIAQKRADETSGGERRRLSIACQLAHRPHVLLLDEPTSGLDSELAYDVMHTLQQYAHHTNSIVVCTLNQPGKRILPAIDQFCFLQRGRVRFHGTLKESETFFTVSAEEAAVRAPTDIIIDQLQKEQDANPNVASPLIGKMKCPADSHFSPLSLGTKEGFGPFVKRLRILLRRNAVSRLSSPWAYLAELILKFVAFPVFVAIMFAGGDDPMYVNRIGIIIVVVSAYGFVGLVTPSVLFASEAVVHERETRAGDYSPMTYMLARWLFEAPGEIAFLLLGSGVCLAIVNFHMNFGYFFVTCLLAYWSLIGIGACISVIPQPLSVTAGLAAVMIVGFMMSSDVICTPQQIARTRIWHSMEFLNPVRHAIILQMRAETADSVIGSLSLNSFGFTRVIDESYFLWPNLLGALAVYRMCALFLAWVRQHLDRSQVPRNEKGSDVPRVVSTEPFGQELQVVQPQQA